MKHPKSVSSVEWHFKGDYFSTVMPSGNSKAVLVHQISKKITQSIAREVFQYAQFFKKSVRVYDLVKNKHLKKLEPGLREISSFSLHAKDITSVAFHISYPLFASCSEDSTAYVFHGMVYSDLNQDPLIVPLESLHGHKSSNGRGVLDCFFHPRQPWLFTAGSDSVLKLYCNH